MGSGSEGDRPQKGQAGGQITNWAALLRGCRPGCAARRNRMSSPWKYLLTKEKQVPVSVPTPDVRSRKPPKRRRGLNVASTASRPCQPLLLMPHLMILREPVWDGDPIVGEKPTGRAPRGPWQPISCTAARVDGAAAVLAAADWQKCDQRVTIPSSSFQGSGDCNQATTTLMHAYFVPRTSQGANVVSSVAPSGSWKVLHHDALMRALLLAAGARLGAVKAACCRCRCRCS